MNRQTKSDAYKHAPPAAPNQRDNEYHGKRQQRVSVGTLRTRGQPFNAQSVRYVIGIDRHG